MRDNSAQATVRKGSPLLPIFLIVLVDILGLTIILPLLPFYAERLGATPAVVGWLVATYAVCQLISGPILGQISDRIGRKPLLLLSQAGTLAGFFVLAFAGSLGVVFLSRVIDGLTAGNLSLAQAYISDVTEPRDRARSFGIIGIAFGLGFLVGPGVSGLLSQFGYSVPIFAAAALSFTSILATWFLLPKASPHMAQAQGPGTGPQAAEEPPPPAGRRLGVLDWRGYAKYFAQPGLAALLIQFFLYCFAFSTFMSGFALFAERRYSTQLTHFGVKQVGYVFAYAGLLGVILQGGLIGRLVKRFGERKLVIAGFACVAVGYVLLGFTYVVPTLLLAMTVSSCGTGITRPTLTSLITQHVSRREQGTVLGLNQSMNSIAQILAPILAGALIDQGWLVAWACVGGGAAALALLLAPRMGPMGKAGHFEVVGSNG